MPISIPTEIILTLKLLKGIGDKTIISKILSNLKSPLVNVKDLYTHIKSLKGKKFEEINEFDIENANIAAKRMISEAENEGVGIITYYDKTYPENLRLCCDEQGKLDPPLILFYRGNIGILSKPGIAIIGTREPTPNGAKAGLFFSSEFSKRGYNVVSGLAVGCDTSAHRGALSVNGCTTAFLANGLDWDSIYPKENLDLAKDIVANGGVLLSEYPLGQSCNRYGLVARDRLQAGLSIGTIVIQTGVKGGTMHAVNATLASKKPLFAVKFNSPYDNEHEKVQGNIFLIKERGAHILQSSALDSALEIFKTAQPLNTPIQDDQKTLFDL